MKIAVMIIGLIGAIAVLGLGAKWISDYNSLHDKIQAVQTLANAVGKNDILAAGLKKMDSLKVAGYLMVLGGLASIIASLLLNKLKKISAAIFIASALVPAFFAPQSLLFGFLLIIAGSLAFFIKPKEAALA